MELEYGFARISLLGQETVTPIIFGADESEPNLGVLALEGLRISIDPKTRFLKREHAWSLKGVGRWWQSGWKPSPSRFRFLQRTETTNMSVDYDIYETGNKLRHSVPLGTLRFFETVFMPAVRSIRCKWLPDIIDRAGLHVDSANRDAILDEITRLTNRLDDVVSKRHQASMKKVLATMRKVTETEQLGSNITGYIG